MCRWSSVVTVVSLVACTRHIRVVSVWITAAAHGGRLGSGDLWQIACWSKGIWANQNAPCRAAACNVYVQFIIMREHVSERSFFVCISWQSMAARPLQRPNGVPRDKICQFKLVLLGEWKCVCVLALTMAKCKANLCVCRDGGWLLALSLLFLSLLFSRLLLFLPTPFPSPGETAVGKSSLVLRFVKGQFNPNQEVTIGGEQ